MENKAEKMYQEALAKINAGKRVPVLRVIRMKCLDCCCWQENEVRECPAEDCILWKFRMGKNPVKRVMSEEQRKASAERLRRMRR